MLSIKKETIRISRQEYEQLLAVKRLFEGQKEINQNKAFEANGINELREQLMS